MTTFRAIFAGGGILPSLLSACDTVALTVKFSEMPFDGAQGDIFEANFKDIGAVFVALHQRNIKEICFAGVMARPEKEDFVFEKEIDTPLRKILETYSKGDDGLLRQLAQFVEMNGFKVIGAHEIRPDLICKKGNISARDPSKSERKNNFRGKQILDILSSEDIGQAVVIDKGLCLGLETLPGTDALLSFVRKTRKGQGGVLIKRAKRNQDLRFDMPAIGVNTVYAARDAGLSAIALSAGSVLLLDAHRIINAANLADIAIWAEP